MRFLAVAALAIVLSGCFQTKTLVKLNADGSGTVEETVLMNSTLAMTMMMGASGMMDGDAMAGSPMLEGPYDEAALAERAEAMGATLAGVEPIKILFGAGYTATYAFEDINGLRLSTDPEGLFPSDFGGGLFDDDDEWEEPEVVYSGDYRGYDPKKSSTPGGDYADVIGDGEIIDEAGEIEPDFGEPGEMMEDEIVEIELEFDEPLPAPEAYDEADLVYLGDEPAEEPITFTYRDGRLTVRLPQPDASGAEPVDDGDMPSAEEFRQFGVLMADMRFSLQVEMPGEITETTARHASGRTLTLYDVDFGRVFSDPGAVEAFMELGAMGEPDLSRAALAALAEIPGVVFEPEQEVSASFRAE